MSDTDKKEDSGCCKGFDDAACPCVDEKTGERDCGDSCGNDCGGGSENDKGGCCTPGGGCRGPN